MTAGTKFTMEPPSTLHVVGSSARFHEWELVFGDLKDWNDFEQIAWGKTDNRVFIKTKYITIDVISGNLSNLTLYASVKSRASWAGNCSRQQGCQVVSILKNVSKLDETTYGCTTIVWSDHIRNGPVNLVVTGEYIT